MGLTGRSKRQIPYRDGRLRRDSILRSLTTSYMVWSVLHCVSRCKDPRTRWFLFLLSSTLVTPPRSQSPPSVCPSCSTPLPLHPPRSFVLPLLDGLPSVTLTRLPPVGPQKNRVYQPKDPFVLFLKGTTGRSL